MADQYGRIVQQADARWLCSVGSDMFGSYTGYENACSILQARHPRCKGWLRVRRADVVCDHSVLRELPEHEKTAYGTHVCRMCGDPVVVEVEDGLRTRLQYLRESVDCDGCEFEGQNIESVECSECLFGQPEGEH